MKFQVLAIAISLLLTSCSSKKNERIVILTESAEFAPYIELFNETHSQKALLVYSNNPASQLYSKQNDFSADLVVASWLRNEKTKKHFMSVDFLFDRKYVQSDFFYPMLLKAGKFSYHQYLLPVNFNIPAIIFSKENAEFVKDDYTITLESLKETSKNYNEKNKKGNFTRLGFAPQSSDAFLYLATKIRGANFTAAKNVPLLWDEKSLSGTIDFVANWIKENNESAKTESDFVYKYLSQTDDKRVLSRRSLFAYTTSEHLFKYSDESLSKIDFRWIETENEIPVEDSMLMMGILKNAKNKSGAADFISWFFEAETQKMILEREHKMNLNVTKFGIADGFSSVREVNEKVLPIYYKSLFSNIPQGQTFKVYDKKPTQWEEIKQNVVIPYIKEKIANCETKKSATTSTVPSINERYAEWRKYFFE